LPTKWLVKNQKVKFWSIFTISLEPILSKIPEKIHSLRPAASRRLRRPASQKNFLYIFYFARANFLLLKGKENFSARLPRLKARGGGASLRLAGKKFPPPNPPLFACSPKLGGEYTCG